MSAPQVSSSPATRPETEAGHGVTTLDTHEFSGDVARMLLDIRGRGVRLWARNGRLHCEIPEGSLTEMEIEKLRASKRDILAFVQQTNYQEEVTSTPLRRRPADRVPLTLAQLLQWHSIISGERLCQRATASAVRVRGPVSVEALRQSVEVIVGKHEALRTNIVMEGGVPVQHISDRGKNYFEQRAFSALPSTLALEEVQRSISAAIRDPIDPTRDPLFLLTLFRFGDCEYAILLAMEHIISDACSLNILWRDFFDAYFDVLERRPAPPLALPVQYPDYAVWQAKACRAWLQRYGAKWNARLQGSAVAHFPADTELDPPLPARGWAAVPVRINSTLTTEWRRWCRERRTTLPVGAFAIYVALVLRWCGSGESIFQYQISGRPNPLLENAVGLFASVLYLRGCLNASDTFIELINRITEEYCRSYGGGELCSMATQIPRPEFSRSPAFNWIPARPGLKQGALGTKIHGIEIEDMPFVNPVLETLAMDADPGITFVDDGDEIAGSFVFPLRRFSRRTMERFADSFLVLLKSSLRRPDARVMSISFDSGER